MPTLTQKDYLMSFYSAYFDLLKNIYNKQIGKDASKKCPSLEDLFKQIADSGKPQLLLSDVEFILNELLHLNYIISSLKDPELTQEFVKLPKVLLSELSGILQGKTPSASLITKWLQKNDLVASFLLKSLNIRVSGAIAVSSIPAQSRWDLLHVVLNRAFNVTIYPPKKWYVSVDELKLLCNSSTVLQLAFTDLDAFYSLHTKYPGFLIHMVECFEDLSTFCQLLPDTFEEFLDAPEMQYYLNNRVNVAKIIEKIDDLSLSKCCQILGPYIRNMEDLANVINAYPQFKNLIAVKSCKYPRNAPLEEGPCAHHIKTREDLLKFDLSSLDVQFVIRNTPRLRRLIGTDPVFLLDSIQTLIAPRILASLHQDRNSICYGFGLFSPTPFTCPPTAELESQFMTLGQAINWMQFHEDAGYYSNGNIEFISDNKTNDSGHFMTKASSGHALAICLSYRAFEIWQQLSQKEPLKIFEILECGAGEGDLCLKMLQFTMEMAKENSNWAQFAKSIHYTIVEIAPALVRRQKAKLAGFIAAGTVEVIEDDALKMRFYPKKANLHISNELPDMYPSEQVRIDESGKCQVNMILPILTPNAYEYLKIHHPESIADIEKEDAAFRHLLYQRHVHAKQEGFVVTSSRFKQLLSVTAKKGFSGPKECFSFTHYHLPLNLFPQIVLYLKQYEEVLTGMNPGDSKIICPALDTYAKIISEKADISIVIDYGDSTQGIKNSDYRSFGSAAVYRNLFLKGPGENDITFDVDFSTFLLAFKQCPHVNTTLIPLSRLAPKSVQLPQSYPTDFTKEVKGFKSSNFYVVIAINSGLPVVLKGMKSAPPATNYQLFSTIIQEARKTLQLNEKEAASAGTLSLN